jgi:hypothetical protein
VLSFGEGFEGFLPKFEEVKDLKKLGDIRNRDQENKNQSKRKLPDKSAHVHRPAYKAARRRDHENMTTTRVNRYKN